MAVRLARLGLHVTWLDASVQCWISRCVQRGKQELRIRVSCYGTREAVSFSSLQLLFFGVGHV